MATTLAQLFTARTQAAILADMYATGATLGVDVIGVQAERMYRALYEIEAAAKAREDYLRVQVAYAGFLGTVKLANTASDGTVFIPPNWTDLLAKGFFNLTRYSAVATVGNASLTCSAAAAPGNVPAGQARFASSAGTGGIVFKNKYSFTVTPSTTVPVTLVAEIPGITGNVGINSITTNVTTLAGCTISNPGSGGSWITTTGADYETDDALIARCLARWAASSYGGARSAYAQWVVDAFDALGLTPTVTRIGVDDTNPNGAGSTDVYLANATGAATAEEVAIVDAFLQPRRALGTGPLRVFAAPATVITIAGTIQGNTGGAALGTANLLALEAVIKPGGKVYRAAIEAALMAPSVPGAYNVILTAPLADTQLATFAVPDFSITLAATI